MTYPEDRKSQIRDHLSKLSDEEFSNKLKECAYLCETSLVHLQEHNLAWLSSHLEEASERIGSKKTESIDEQVEME
jgi:uncharacterized damage-inducible protein DinB